MLKCKVCNRRPEEISEYVIERERNNMTAEEFVRQEEGTLNSTTGYFYCTDCYVKIGMPGGTA